MSLIEQWQEKCTIIESKKVPDGEGGWQAAFRARLNPYRKLREI